MSKSVEEKKTSTKSKANSTKKKTSSSTTKATSKPIKTEEITLEEADAFYHVSLLAQIVCVVGVLAISILAIFENSFTVPIEILVGITLLIMAYNNMRLFKRKGMTTIYIIFGLISFIVGVCNYFEVCS